MKPVQTIKILMLFSAWIDFQVCWGLTFGDWSLKFKPPKKKIYNKFYDAKWAYYVMHRNRNHKPNISGKILNHFPFRYSFYAWNSLPTIENSNFQRSFFTKMIMSLQKLGNTL